MTLSHMNHLDQLAANVSSRPAIGDFSSCPAHPPTLPTEPTFSEAKRAQSPLSLNKRRSVASMKGLIPLALSPERLLPASLTSSGEMLETHVDGYFPEFLAEDLERSSAILASKQGMPSTHDTMMNDEGKDFPAGPGWPSRHQIATQQHQPASGPVRQLGPIEERRSVVSFIEHGAHTDSSSADDDDSFYGNEGCVANVDASSITCHEVPLSTAATSFTSNMSLLSLRHSSLCGPKLEQSWVEPDSDEEEEEEEEHVGEVHISSLSPRPPTPHRSVSCCDHAADIHDIPFARSRSHKTLYSPSVPSVLPVRQRSIRLSKSVSSHSRVTPTGYTGYAPSAKASTPSPTSSSFSPTDTSFCDRPVAARLQAPATLNRKSSLRSRHSTRTRDEAPPSIKSARAARTQRDDESDEDSIGDQQKMSDPSVFIRPSPPPSPLPSVQSWLNGSALPYTAQCQGDDLAKAIPLPPNVMETLRVSVACFPETMLLMSSLTIETIRNYSRKVRQPTAELASSLMADAPSAGTTTPHRSLWKRVVTYKRGPQASARDRTRSPSPAEPGLTSPSFASLASSAPPPWSPLRNVFGPCSDYILDALWAHIVAYNYLSALIPRTASRAHVGTGRRRSSTSNGSQKDEIPKKAASLLGLAATTQGHAMPTVENGGPKLRAATSLWNLNRERMVLAEQQQQQQQQQPSSKMASMENTTRDIQTGLMRCIVRLIATAQLMAEDGTADGKIVEMETRGVDMLFTRSLCEIVRMSEECGSSC